MIKWYFWAPFRKQQRELIINWVKIGQHTSEQIRWPEHPRRKRSPGRIIRGTSVPSDDRAQYPSARWEFNMAFPFEMCFVPDKHCKSISGGSGRARSRAGKTPDVLPRGTPAMARNAELREEELYAWDRLWCWSKYTARNEGGTTTQLVLLFRIPSSLTFTAALGQHWNQLSSYYSQLQREELLHHCTMHACLGGGRLGLENKEGNLVAPKSNVMINEGAGRGPGVRGQPYNLSRLRQMANIHIIAKTKQKQKIPWMQTRAPCKETVKITSW